jgi:hypothetical protein
MRWTWLLRIAFVTATVVLFVGSLAGIMFTGPVVVRAWPLVLDASPSPERLRSAVVRLCGELSPRNPRHPQKLDAAARWIAAELRTAGLEVELQDYRLPEGVFLNVIGRHAGTDPAAPITVIGAHYDVHGEGPGADDNASGVAVLLELARTLPPARPRATRVFAAFATEEEPFYGTERMGSHVFARRLREEGARVETMISLDLVGYFSDARGSQRLPLPGLSLLYPDRGNFIAIVGDLHSGPSIMRVKRGMMATGAIPVHSFRAPASRFPVLLSDHWSFRQMGFPAVQITDTAFMRYPYYHTPGDVPERLDYERMAALVLALHGVLFEPPE